jgi:CTP:molybdopterin cytidylyltransferase MocA
MTVAAVILAAGSGSRFGKPKGQVRIGSRTLVGIVADVATAAGLSPVIVVAPPGLAVPETVLAVLNEVPSAGLSRSLRLGVAAVPPEGEAAVILLADQPTVDVALLHELDSWRGGTPIIATRADGVLGPPVLMEREAFSMVDGLTGDIGLRELLRADLESVTAVDHEPLPDIDTPVDLEAITEPCSGCGTRYLPQMLDETHPYIGASPACWATFGEVLAREFENVTFGRVHRHTVDVYSVQHPGTDDRRQRQSVALHLIGICHWLEHDLGMERLNAITQRLANSDRDWPWLDPPAAFPMTVVDVLQARDGPEHVQLVRRWAESTWDAWSAHHDQVRAWASEALQ